MFDEENVKKSREGTSGPSQSQAYDVPALVTPLLNQARLTGE